MNQPVALVTGASSGIGREIVAELSRTHDVIGVGRNQDALGSLGIARTVTANLRAPETFATNGVFAQLFAELPRLDVIVHSAAVGTPWAFDDTTLEEWHRQFDTNVIAPAALTNMALPLIRAAEGTIVFIGSGVSVRPAKNMAAYVATKHALKGLADTLRLEVEPQRVRVATIMPGQVATPMQVELQDRTGGTYTPERYIQPESVAQAVRFVVDAPADVQIPDLTVRPRQVP